MLFKTTEELKKYLPANAAFEFDKIQPFILLEGEPDIIIPTLGQVQYDLLDAAYKNGTISGNAVLEKLLDKVRFPLANYGYLKMIPTSQVVISASGIHIETTGEKKTAFPWQILKLEESFAETADKGIEALYEFLEANKADYTDWASSDERSILKECFINTAKEFSRYYGIGNSRRTFLAMKHIMMDVEKKIKKITGKTLFDQIKTEIKTGPLAELNEDLLEFIKPAVAKLTASRALVELNVKITGSGVRINNITATDGEEKKPAEIDRLGALQNETRADGEAYLKELTDHLNENADDYPDFKAESSAYINPDDDDDETDQSDNAVVAF